MDLEKIVMNVFMFIGMIVCIVVTAIALVWVTCFVVRMLVKSFGLKVSSYCDIMAEDIKTKSEHKKELKRKKRLIQKSEKEEFVKIKLINKKRRNDIKKKKLSIKLKNQQNDYSMKVLGVPLEDVEFYEPEEEVPNNGMALIEELFPSTKLPTEETQVDPNEGEFVIETDSTTVEIPEEVSEVEEMPTEEVVEEVIEEVVEEVVSDEEPVAFEPVAFAPIQPVEEPVEEEVMPVEEPVEEVQEEVVEEVQEQPAAEVKPKKKRGRKPKNR